MLQIKVISTTFICNIESINYEPFTQKANLLTKNIEIGAKSAEQTKKNLF